MADKSTTAADRGRDMGRLRVEVEGRRVRVRTPEIATQWLPDTPRNRHLAGVWWRLLVDDRGKPLSAWPDFAPIVGSTNRQAASQHLADVRQCEEDLRAFVLRKRKVDATVVEGVLAELLQTPLAGPTEVLARVQRRLGRQDLSVANIERALEPIACVPVRRTLRRQLAAGPGHDQAAWRLTELLEGHSLPAGLDASHGVPSNGRGMRLADPTALTALVTPDRPMAEVPGSRCWLSFLMTRFYWTVPLSVLGRWCGVHQTTILRWVVGWAMGLWPLVSPWLGARVQAPMVYVDETWLKIRGRWQSWLVVLDVPTALPVRAALLPARSQGACRGVGRQLRQLKNVPKGLITDGWRAYAYLVPGAKHVLCHVHHQQGVTHGLPQHLKTDAAINAPQLAMKRLLHTRDQRTVRRRLARLRERAAAWGMTPGVTQVEEKLPQLLGSVGSIRIPSTTKAIERFFRAFQRFYATRRGFHSVRSATCELRLLLVVDVFTQQATTGRAPIEGIVPEARRMPLYRLLNDPFQTLQERTDVKPAATMADLLLPQEVAA